MNTAEIARLLNALGGQQCDLRAVVSALSARLADLDDASSAATLWALNYRLIGSSDEASRNRHGPFGPLHEAEGPSFPPKLSDVAPTVLEIWQELADAVAAPAVTSRLQDLLWVRRHGESPHLHARLAVENYISATRLRECGGLEAVKLLDRALDIASQLSSDPLIELVISELHDLLERELRREGDSLRPGVLVPCFLLLAKLTQPRRPPDLQERLAEAHERLKTNDPFTREPLFQVGEILWRGNRAEVGAIRRGKVEMWFEWALKQEGLLRSVELSKALELADNTPEASDLRDDIRRQIQRIRADDLGLRKVSVEFRVPTQDLEGLVDAIVGDESLDVALGRFGTWGPPSGDPAATLLAVEEEIRGHPFRFLVPHVVTHPAGYPIQFIETDEGKRNAEQVRLEVLAISTGAVVDGVALQRIRSKYSPSKRQLQKLFETEFIRGHQAEALARAFKHYWAGRPDECILVALPRIEAVLRQVLAEVGGVVYREPLGARAGGVKTLGDVLRDLQSYLDQKWWRFLWVLLSEPLGLNLRNEHVHGLAASSTKANAALILQAASFLRSLRLSPSQQADSMT